MLRPRPLRVLPPAVRLVLGLAALVGVGTLLLMLPGVGAYGPLPFSVALFTATSALTVTGLSLIAPGRDLTPAGQVLLLILTQVGGLGFMVLAVLALSLVGRRVALVSRLALRDSMGLLSPRAILRLTRQVIVAILIIEGLGALALWAHWVNDLGAGRALLYGAFHSVAAFCNAGFDLFGGLPEYPHGLPNDDLTLTILGALIFLGGLGIPVLDDLLTWPRDHRLSLHTRLTLVVILFLIVFGALALWLSEVRPGGLVAGLPAPRQLSLALFQSISARTAGFMAGPTFPDLQPASQMVMILLMFIGSAPASMGGGITTGTFAVLLISVWSYARGLQQPIVAGRRLSDAAIRRAAAILTISLAVVVTATWLILLAQPVSLDQALFEVISAFATCGLSLAFTDDLNGFSQAVIMLVMFWGRLGPLTIIIALARQAPPARVKYPEEQVFIG